MITMRPLFDLDDVVASQGHIHQGHIVNVHLLRNSDGTPRHYLFTVLWQNGRSTSGHGENWSLVEKAPDMTLARKAFDAWFPTSPQEWRDKKWSTSSRTYRLRWKATVDAILGDEVTETVCRFCLGLDMVKVATKWRCNECGKERIHPA